MKSNEFGTTLKHLETINGNAKNLSKRIEKEYKGDCRFYFNEIDLNWSETSNWTGMVPQLVGYGLVPITLAGSRWKTRHSQLFNSLKATLFLSFVLLLATFQSEFCFHLSFFLLIL
jgi:hypothetical protein